MAAPMEALQEVCQHQKITKKGANAYYSIETCLDCGKLLKRERKDGAAVSSTSTSSKTSKPKVAEEKTKETWRCEHHRVTWRGTNWQLVRLWCTFNTDTNECKAACVPSWCEQSFRKCAA